MFVTLRASEYQAPLYDMWARLLAQMHATGVGIMAGTDAGLGDAQVGESLHQELELLVAAGITPAQALLSATREPANYLGRNGITRRGRAGKIGRSGSPRSESAFRHPEYAEDRGGDCRRKVHPENAASAKIEVAMPFQVFEAEAASILSTTTGFIAQAGFTHSLTPARNCTFGCSYCYVPTMRIYGGLKPEDWSHWGQFTTFKSNAPALLKRQLHAAQIIYCSPLVDPYQAAEATEQLMPRILDQLLARPPKLFVVQTRGPLIVRDLARLVELSRRTSVRVSFFTYDGSRRRPADLRAALRPSPAAPGRDAYIARCRDYDFCYSGAPAAL